MTRLLRLFVLLAACAAPALAQSPPLDDIPRILTVFEADARFPAMVGVADGMEATLGTDLMTRGESYNEYLELFRFPEQEYRDRMATMFTAKYGDIPLDVIIAMGPGAAAFVVEHRASFAPGVPLIVGGVIPEILENLALEPMDSGVISLFDATRTVDFAQTLQPDATDLVVMSGSGPFDEDWEQTTRATFGDEYHGLVVTYANHLSIEGFKAVAANLDRETILLLLTINIDAAGQRFVPREAVEDIAAVSAAPIYTAYDSFIGHGALGGDVESFFGIGASAAALALRILGGEDVGGHFVDATSRPIVDWRQVKRWDIDPTRLPEGTERWFYEPTIWEKYWRLIVVVATIIVAQAITIIALLAQMRRRRLIELALAEGHFQLVHLSRATLLGQLSGALAHELNQPLTAILANAEAGSRLLQNDLPDLAEVSEILADIATDDRRAADIIVQLRRLMIKGDSALEVIDLNHVVSATLVLMKSELQARQNDVELRLAPGPMLVNGNFSQLQQIVLNLTLNASEAMATLPVGSRKIVIETVRKPDGKAELSVNDNGIGLTPEIRADVFKPFFTTKTTGLGFGLSICDSIARAHLGTFAFDDTVTQGARIVLTLPPLRED